MARNRADRMYSKSPRIMRNPESGRAEVTREPLVEKSVKEDSKSEMDIYHKHSKARADLNHKHEQEHLELSLQHAKELESKEMKPQSAGGTINEAG